MWHFILLKYFVTSYFNIRFYFSIKREIEPCNTCESNLCKNSGVCQEAYAPKGYKCICSSGYSGEMCESTGQSCYPSKLILGRYLSNMVINNVRLILCMQSNLFCSI